MAFSGPPQAAGQRTPTTAGLALVPTDEPTAPQSIEQEPLSGPGWHDSSWMLKQGLDVDENPPAEAIPPEWAWRWWLAACNA